MIMKNPRLSICAASLLILSVSSCNNSNEDSGKYTQSDSTKESNIISNKEWKASEMAGTYSFEKGGDTIKLDLKNQNDSLIGNLSYSFKEKDKNQGSFRGVLKDSLIVGNYTFMSEGVISVRETVFGIVPEGLIEGFGDVEEKNSQFVFKNIDSLRFDHGMVLKRK